MRAPEDLARHPNPLAAHYAGFRVAERLLLTGHSHQAWPDVSRAAQDRAWLDAAEAADQKWALAEAQAARLRQGFGRLLGDAPERIALGQNTHELVTRLLSALPLGERPRLVTTDGEFHTVRRQLARLAEAGLEVVRLPAAPVGTLSERLARAVNDRTACVLVSAVLFQTAEIVPHLGAVASACLRAGAALLVDAYHALNVVPLSLAAEGLEGAFVTGGGYKYCQLGEGCCFLRTPPGTTLRPVLTGWFAELGALEAPEALEAPVALEAPGGAIPAEGLATRGTFAPAPPVAYADGPARFAGATYDPASHYRGAAVFDFFRAEGLDPALLRRISQHQVGRLAARFDALDVDPAVLSRDRVTPLSGLGGFLVLRSPRAAALVAALRARGVHTDARGDALRLGPAPYLSDPQLDQAMDALAEVLASPFP